MRLYSEGKKYKLYHGDMLDMLEVIEPNSIDSIVCDPPYELGFMNKSWDNSGIAFQKETWENCLKVLKPGGYLLAFGGSRTYHRIACAIEDAGFEIRDTIMYLYGTGFPKSMNLGKAVEAKLTIGSANTQDWKKLKGTKTKAGNWGINTNLAEQGARPRNYDLDGHERTMDVDYSTEEGKKWDGWGTALKPAYEPIIIARKPCEGSCIENVLKYGVGGINIDGCRVPISQEDINMLNAKSSKNPTDNYNRNVAKKYGDYASNIATPANEQGRFPANVILTYDETDFEEVCGGMPETSSSGGVTTMPSFSDAGKKNTQNKIGFNDGESAERIKSEYVTPMDSGNASRYFYCAKASSKDRDEGLEQFELQRKAGYGYDRGYMDAGEGMFKERQTLKRNTHPTVKPCELMQYLVRLVTPKGGTVLDPFNGSGSTGKAVMYENRERDEDYKYIGIELTEEYLPISEARISVIANQNHRKRLI